MKFAPIVVAAAVALPAFAESALLQQGRQAYERQDYRTAASILEREVQQDPNDGDAHAYLGASYGYLAMHANLLRRASMAVKCRDEFQKAVALEPDQKMARIGLLEYYTLAPGFLGGSIDLARQQAAYIASKDSLGGHRANAFIDVHLKQVDLARREMLAGVAEQPQSAKAHYYLGTFYADTDKNYPAALNEFETAVKLDPAYMPAQYGIGHCAALSGTDLQRGQQALVSYLGHKPKSDEPSIDDANRCLQQIQEKEGMASGAAPHR